MINQWILDKEKEKFAAMFFIIVFFFLGMWSGRSNHDCPEPDHTPCEIAIEGLTEGMRLSRVAFGDVVNQFNECNKELRLCRGYIPPIEGDYDE